MRVELADKKQWKHGAKSTSSPPNFSILNSQDTGTGMAHGIYEHGAVCCMVTVHFLVFWWLRVLLKHVLVLFFVALIA